MDSNNNKTYSPTELMNMNRHERRRIGKFHDVKIPGIQDKHLEQRKAEVHEKLNRMFVKNFMTEKNTKQDSITNIAESKV